MRPNYREREVRALVERYEEWQGMKDVDARGIRPLLSLVDLQRALRQARLSPIEKHVIFLHGMCQMTTRVVGEEIKRDQKIVLKHYNRAIEKLVNYLNGGRY